MAQQSESEAIRAIQQKYQVLFLEQAIAASQSASVFKPNEGRVLSVLGDTLTCKSSDTQSWRFFEVVGSAGGSVPPHTHLWHVGLYVLAGEAKVLLDDQTVQATPGYCIQMPAGTLHTYRILSPQAKFLCWAADSRAEAGFAEMSGSIS
jgi:quercetin dioxygenase-like cupin family protein